jgi:hypothetical protein
MKEKRAAWARSPRRPGHGVNNDYRRRECTCNRTKAVVLLDGWADRASRGDDDAKRMLPAIAQHFLDKVAVR